MTISPCRSGITALFLSALLAPSSELHAQHFEPRVPGESWMRYATPEEAGWSSAGIAEARAFADSVGSRAVMLIHDGVVVTAWGRTAEVAPIFSIRKGLMSALIGIAEEEGQIARGATLASLGIDDIEALSEAERQATVFHLLTTSSGIYHLAAAEPPGLVKPRRGSAAPGEVWHYNNWDFNVLSTIYEERTGTRVFEALSSRIAEPLGMEDFHPDWGTYVYQPGRSRHPAQEVWMSARDLARFGLLYLREGRWNGAQIVPAAWVRESGSVHMSIPGPHAAGYGLSWWVPAGPLEQYRAYHASGAGNQLVTVLPDLNVVFVQRASSILHEGVNGLDAREILHRLLAARTGEPSANPDLVPMDTD